MNLKYPFRFPALLAAIFLAVALHAQTAPAAASTTPASLTVNSIFGDHMVLQRGMAVPVWGTAPAGDKITVSFAGQTVTATAAADGKWIARLSPMKASAESRTLTVTDSSKTEFQDVLVGDVWLCSGQSNMELSAGPPPAPPGTPPPAKPLNVGLPDATREQEVAAANHPDIRFNKIGSVMSLEPKTEVKGRWVLSTPETMRTFSTAAYFFGRELNQKLGVPIGLIGAYYGGANGVSFTRREALLAQPELKPQIDALDARIAQRGPRLDRYTPTVFYNGMIAPLMPFAIKGVIWYQGEADTANAPQAARYATLFPAMIQDWRAQWKEGDFPFLFVQLPTSEPQYPDPTDSAWARVRESQQKALSVKNTAMIVLLDISGGEKVHAPNKKQVGERLGAAALHEVYGKKNVLYQGPFFKSMEIKNGAAILSFDHVGHGLAVTNPDGLKGFAIAGADRNFVWADAKIQGDKIVVSSPGVKAPVAVRYAWADNPVISVSSKDGLPLAPFRTDDWAAGTSGKVSNPRASP
ncbi:MAG TPA: sialate O-acetylesterase [Acidobacteriaceae bacterium]|nr:sialate O-acetylesterase [Acidobacteriaceae bacterium]